LLSSLPVTPSREGPDRWIHGAASATGRSAFCWMFSVVGEVALPLVRPAMFSKHARLVLVQSSALLVSSGRFWRSCALDVPSTVGNMTNCLQSRFAQRFSLRVSR
jgi:hypothetical protein